MPDEILLKKGQTIGLSQYYGEGIWAMTISGYDGVCDHLVADDLREIARRLLEVANGKETHDAG
jgi:hypothetical protein